MDQLAVSIIAGPAATVFLRHLGSGTMPGTGVLACSKVPEGNNRPRTYQLPPDSSPEQVLNKMRRIAEQKEIEHLVICCEAERPP